MTIANHYGTMELNPLSVDQKAAQNSATRSVDWTEPGLEITRLRLLSDPGFPVWDVSYVYGVINGEPVEVILPFSQLPKFGYRQFLYKEAKKTGCFIKGLFNSISTLN